ncbi:MAG TPA: di-heme oxidoredictase family protein, partial [Steroidobacteraceae bacterium]|nr:di-heme oxidoredictase family protein [Steroidobacteraceae bacterium]
GAANTNGNDGRITRFGWKAQNKSGLLFVAEAYNVEMGISNEIFQTEREENANCQFSPVPNSVQDTDAITNTTTTKDAALGATADIVKFANFQRFSAPPTPASSGYTTTNGTVVSAASIARGKQRFIDVGCHLCHTPTLTTNPNTSVKALANQPVNAFSDFALHGMGPGLADGVSQGAAKGDEFRSAPLWGVGQRIFLLHDGRTTDIRAAIEAHFSNANSQFGASEANAVIVKFENLGFGDTQDLLNFLRSL